ncbi:hypothetical protein [Chryseobacterium oryctis]|uniref:Lipoprotein n=1 Tax=Chryseobacterium oryctis TaxID=2952618 RepID=A0ABT3HJT4_9FLAO|nr:hypothetical protein [Chryseobacterium oryctis]MCW3160051.1 hypothetical protein [Chryseobacterium oryctis]
MRTLLLLASILFIISSCSSVKKTEINENLPKDISERPADEDSKKYDQASLDKVKADIESTLRKEKCTEATIGDWKYAAMGSQPCGGPKSYIAYPSKLEETILPILELYNNKEKEFNKKYDITSDCIVVEEPIKIRCINEKAELIFPAQ